MNWKLLGTSLKWDSAKTYPIMDARNQPDWKKRKAVFMAHDPEDVDLEFGSILLEKGEYEEIKK